MFARDSSGALDMYFNATFSVFCTPQVMVCGGIGPMSALAVKSKSISENEVGMGQTTSWRVCSLNSNTSVAVYYEIVNQHSNPIPSGTPFYLQFCVRYKRSNGEIRLRVMTVARRWAESSSSHDVVSGACFFRLFHFFCFFCFFCPLTACPSTNFVFLSFVF
jgi:protein transport protein SEC23